jgi:NAD+ diphosphatase
MARPPLVYAGGHLDRAGAARKDPDWVAARLGDPDTCVVPLCEGRNLITGLEGDADGPTPVVCRGEGIGVLVEAAGAVVFLGLEEGRAVFAVDLAEADADRAIALAGAGAFVDLRRIGGLIAGHDAALLAYARGMMHWHRTHRFCGRCGRPTESRDGGHVRVCSDPACAAPTFPRTDPAVIMLVDRPAAAGRPPTCLLGWHRRLPPGVFTTLAGFVEPGESLEEAVAREVLEETGVRVTDVTYQASQPWPFPASIMLGFRARAVTHEIRLDDEELDEAGWFTADQVRTFGEWADEDAPRRLPRRDSIARMLIDTWVEGSSD